MRRGKGRGEKGEQTGGGGEMGRTGEGGGESLTNAGEMTEQKYIKSNKLKIRVFNIFAGIALCRGRPPIIWMGKTPCGRVEISGDGWVKIKECIINHRYCPFNSVVFKMGVCTLF